MDFLEGLNPQQREAAAYVRGPLLILAGAGSGKTRVITHRIAHLVHAHRVPPQGIVAVTFTNKAADEMRERVGVLLGGSHAPTELTVSTFHSFCVRVLRRDGRALAELRPGFTRSFTIYDEDDQLALLKAVYRHLGVEEKQFMPYQAALSRISHAKNRKQTPKDFYEASKDAKTTRLASIFEGYENRLRQANALDFDDLLLEAVRLMQHDEGVRQAYNRRIEHLLIDEYQDTNRSQYELMRLLSETHRNVCVVGDEDQSIYSWRGADIRNILDFEQDYPDALTFRLEQNYRSTKNILESASALVAHNKERKGKWLWTSAPKGQRIGLYEAPDAEDEALFIADTIERVATGPEDRVGVLYRTNFQSRQIEEALRRYGRKYHVVGGFSFYQRAEIKDILAYLKAVLSPQDSVSLLRIINTPARGIGKTTVEQVERYTLEHGLSLWAALGRMLEEEQFSARAEAALGGFCRLMEELIEAAQVSPLDELLRLIVERTGYQKMLEADDSPAAESRLENLDELVNAGAEAVERGEGIVEFLDHAALVSEADSYDERAQVSLLTLHNAKGLEFPIVFIAGLEERLFPHARSLESGSAMEEERRLCYVGMTRAQRRLILSWARARRKWGGGTPEAREPSRFLREIPKGLTEDLRERTLAPQVDLFAERHQVRESVRRSTYSGKTYNSLENIGEFFASRGLPVPPKSAPEVKPAVRASPPARKQKFALGSEVEHPRYGKGMVIRREGEGDSTKLTVSFPRHGLKKLVEKYAGLKAQE
jgi:DNA helicase-2/ATP-dependent DNA helicase PcrA